MNNDHLRAMTLFEKQLFARFLSQPFSGRDEIAEQISAASVRTIDQDGSLEIQSTSPVLAMGVKARVPVEAEGIKQHLFCKSRFSEVGHLASMFR